MARPCLCLSNWCGNRNSGDDLMRYLKLIPLLCVVCVVAALLPTGALAQQGIINTVAGGGPNNIPALAANLYYPRGIAVDSVGNYYIADYYQCRVFKVDTTGTLTVLAGDGFCNYRGDGGPATKAELSKP